MYSMVLSKKFTIFFISFIGRKVEFISVSIHMIRVLESSTKNICEINILLIAIFKIPTYAMLIPLFFCLKIVLIYVSPSYFSIKLYRPLAYRCDAMLYLKKITCDNHSMSRQTMKRGG